MYGSKLFANQYQINVKSIKVLCGYFAGTLHISVFIQIRLTAHQHIYWERKIMHNHYSTMGRQMRAIS